MAYGLVHSYGVHMVSAWHAHGMCMACTWHVHGMCTACAMLHPAQLWRDFAAEAALPPADIEPVAAWIERTAKHMDGAATGDLAYFLDADLGVLGKPPATYAAYARQIRLEYCHVSPAVFPAARAQAMEGFLQAERLYFTDEAHAQFEASARHNVASEIRRLRALGAS